jgi:predicted Zn-dependent protease
VRGRLAGWNELKEELKVRFAEAVKIRDRGDLNSARQLFLKLAEEDTQSTAIYAVLGDICWDMGLLDEAVLAFSHAVKLSPKLEAVSLGLFHTLWKLEKRVEALEEIKRFQSIADSEDYREIVREINEKW